MAILKNLIVNGVTRIIGDLTASKIIKQGGVSSLFLKADGSVDGNAYIVLTSTARPGVTKLYRRDSDSGYNVLTVFDGNYWVLLGYSGDTYHAPCRVGYADNANKLNGYNFTASKGHYFGKIPIIGDDGVTELGTYIDFHYDATIISDYSTRLMVSGNHGNVVTLPSTSGTLALTSQIPTVTDYYWANVKISNQSNNNTNPTFNNITTNGYLTFGVYGSSFTSDIRNSWRTNIYGDSINTSRLKTVRTDVTIDNFSEVYGSGLTWATGDTHGYLSVSCSSGKAWIGGGSANSLNWSTYLVTGKNIGSLSVNHAASADNANTSSKLSSIAVHPFSSIVFKYRKFASINITSRYSGRSALLLLTYSISTGNKWGNSCKVYINAYLQDEIGNPPGYNIETDCDDRYFNIYAVLNYTSTASTIDLYVYGKKISYSGINVSLLSGDNIIDIGDVISSLPSGTVINPTKYGSVYSASKWTTARKIKLTGSITGEASIDGSSDVTLDTITNHTHSYLHLSGGSMNGNIEVGSTYTYNLGSNTSEFKDAYLRLIHARHLDASAVYSGDHNLYIGYGFGSPTNKTLFYYSTESSRTLFAEINSNGLYALTRFGVNGQNTSYNLYVNGSANITSDLYENGNKVITTANIGSQSVNYATSAGSSNTATIAGSLGDNDTINMYAQYSNEINFGGGNSSSTIYFGCRVTDSRPIPTEFIFGSSTGTANLKASKFIKTGSSDSYVLLGAGGHKAISDFATSGHTHDYIPLSGSTNISGNLRFSREYTFQGYTPRKRGNGGGWNYKPFSIIDYSGSNFAHFGVYGENNDLKYIYIGSNDYDSNDNLRIYPNGNINANNFYANSDIRYKNITDLYYSLSSKIALLPIFKYTWINREDTNQHIGSSALSVMSIIPELVSYDNNTDFYSLDYATLGAVAGISACKEVEMLKLKIKELELEVIILKSKYNG